ncbi:chemotaxis protein CheB [Flavobacterium sp. AED]|uniref:chemotaxis protein CheB n=1 Tax=Flavobacterium sp. AED TaxID=1423323 RepID=UPI00068C0AD3|nr:chemotaxis protein CheB [Flavobacterium sp. AED]
MINKNQISLREDKVLDLKSNSILPEADNNDFPIIGIGASAGGLEALELFFEKMPNNSGMAFVVIQHLDPTHVGIMPELLQRMTQMKVLQATDTLKVKPNSVYVIPPNKSLSILKGKLHLFEPLESRGLRLPIDVFFRSLALDRKEKSIGIIFSGMGSDGSDGLKVIKENNGFVLVQEPASAKFDSMPRNAIEAVIPDIVAPAEELPAKLIALLKYFPKINTDSEVYVKSKSSIDKIIILLREQSGHDFSMYKKNTLMRRIERRKAIHQIDTIQTYVRFLQENPKEVELLFKELLIGVTSFFRDTAVWEKLKEEIIPNLLKEIPNGYTIRAWVPACSTGEEAYSLAIIFEEVIEKIGRHKNIKLQIFATDLDIVAIEKARKGFFLSDIEKEVSPERINNFFYIEKSGYRVNTSIREMIVFAPHDVIKDPPFTKLDLLTCRNMLIYMEPQLQNKLIMLFNYSLNPGGIMVLGTAETIGSSIKGFDIIDSKLKIFKRTSKSVIPEFTNFPSSFSQIKRLTTDIMKETKVVENIQILADQILLQRFSPASILVNDKGDIIYITGRTGKYLEPVAGKANWNIHAMAREGLRNELPAAFRKALQSFDPVKIENVKIVENGSKYFVNLTLQQIESPDALKGMIMLVFSDVPEILESDVNALKEKKQSVSGKQKELEAELIRCKEDLNSTREEMQTSQEELKSTNEELQSTNEELQSTNEELTTSKEELQSLNEELQTVNAELQSKLVDFEQANNDMKNLLNSTEIATLFLDKELNIRRFTDPVTKIFKLRATDTGRPFTDLVCDLNYPDMGSNALGVIRTLSSIQKEVATNDGRYYYVRIMPYRTLDDRIDGLVITFTDITIAKQAEESLKIENRYRRLFESAKDGILILNSETGMIMDVNPYLVEMLGYTHDQFIEKSIWEIGSLKDIVANKDKFLELQKKEFVRYENLPLETAKGKKINVEFVSNVFLVNNIKVIQCIIRDISDRVIVQDALVTLENRFRHLFESVKEGILFLDSETGRIADINPYSTDLLGLSKEKCIGKEIWQIESLKNIIPNMEKFKELNKKEFIHYHAIEIEIGDARKIKIDFTSTVYRVGSKKVIQCFIHEIPSLN